MALAYLCWAARRQYSHLQIADNPVSAYHCITVDHSLRQGSDQEARAVGSALQERFGLHAQQLRIEWHDALEAAGVAHPKDLTNFETLARRLRYRNIALYCAQSRMTSLFLAHHQDDQYETLLMRLLSGHGSQGLLGMRVATDIPESQDIHGAYQSGFFDDRATDSPLLGFRSAELDMPLFDLQSRPNVGPTSMDEFGGEEPQASFEEDGRPPWKRYRVFAPPLEIEDGGIMLYRPLLNFSKDRLVATCEANGIPWFEDATNHDRTLTMRNAVRHLYVNHPLPVALQKPAILAMTNRLSTRAAYAEFEVDLLLRRTVIKFDSTSGTAVVRLPSFQLPRSRRDRHNKVRRQRRLEHYRHLAVLLVKRLITMVTPEPLGAFSRSLINSISRLFPSLDDTRFKEQQDHTPFNLCGVHFNPLPERFPRLPPSQWRLSRQPYVSGQALPECKFARLRRRFFHRRRSPLHRKIWKLWDGRFWITLNNRSPVHAFVAPFDHTQAKAFRDSLPDQRSRDELMLLLKKHAFGKIRSTLPAIYTVGDLNKALPRVDRCSEIRKSKKTLVALPSLGIARPGLQKWIDFEIRYRRVDRRMLALDGPWRNEQTLLSFQQAQKKARLKASRRWMGRCALQRKHRPSKPLSRKKIVCAHEGV